MAGTVVCTKAIVNKNVTKLSVAWTSDASGDATLALPGLHGFLIKAVTDPSGVNVKEIQTVSFGNVPDFGVFKLNYGGNATADIAYTDNAAAVQSALRSLAGLSSVTVAGTFTAGFVVTFEGVNGNAALMTVTANTLTLTAVATTVTVTETIAGSHLIPTDNYDITLVDENSADAAEGLLVNRDTSNTETVYTFVSGAPTPVLLSGIHTFTVANAGNVKSGVAVLYVVDRL